MSSIARADAHVRGLGVKLLEGEPGTPVPRSSGRTSSGGGQIQQIGYGTAAGVLMDTFRLRSLLVPSLVVLLGPWNWWPSHLARTPANGDSELEPLPEPGDA